jgi:hypothetical protein
MLLLLLLLLLLDVAPAAVPASSSAPAAVTPDHFVLFLLLPLPLSLQLLSDAYTPPSAPALPGHQLTVAVVGASISAGLGSSEDGPGWVDRLEAYLRHTYGAADQGGERGQMRGGGDHGARRDCVTPAVVAVSSAEK